MADIDICRKATFAVYRMAICREQSKAAIIKQIVLALTTAYAAEDRAIVEGKPTGEIRDNIVALNWLLINVPDDE